ncbi:MAG: ribose-phosphate pyrophosphokinase, partial [Saprospiraceae bacterium]|nr:ribose-phosphate pyrophosphokinase [Saprospiraceae bacterium]
VLSGKAYENVAKSKLAELIVCDTIPLKTQNDAGGKIKVLSTADFFSKAIRNTVEHKSIAALFHN